MQPGDGIQVGAPDVRPAGCWTVLLYMPTSYHERSPRIATGAPLARRPNTATPSEPLPSVYYGSVFSRMSRSKVLPATYKQKGEGLQVSEISKGLPSVSDDVIHCIAETLGRFVLIMLVSVIAGVV